jgi:hypothetical protein
MGTKDYSKYEQGNKISFKDFAKYLLVTKKVDFNTVIIPQMRKAIKESMEAFWSKILES